MDIEFDNTYVELPDRFYAHQKPVPVEEPKIVRANVDLADQLEIDPGKLDSPAGARFATGNEVPEGAEPIALAYAGHQFGNFVPQLGDGRAVLLGEVVDTNGQRFDIQLKGSGRTPFSRRGDGRAPLGPVLREYIVSEAMDALGIPTTRALAAATTGQQVRRQDGPSRGASSSGSPPATSGSEPSSISQRGRTSRPSSDSFRTPSTATTRTSTRTLRSHFWTP